MPELPEVEAIRQALDDRFTGQRLERLDVFHPDVWRPDPSTQDPACLSGQIVTQVSRRGKYLIMHVTPALQLIIHLRMTGQLRVRPLTAPDESHTHARFIFDTERIDFRDVRRFGRLELSPEASTWASRTSIAKLGPEPAPDSLTLAHLRHEAKRHARLPLKAFLLDQSVIAGIGNIYADEIAFDAGIHPARRVYQLKPSDWVQVHRSILDVILTAVRLGGTSFSDYIHLDGSRGHYQEVAKVYTRAGQPCRTCQTSLIKTRVAGRGTVYCPHCQKAPRGFHP